jgi:predicted neutral ceramidase superfamily lipid hydrolase
LGREKRLSGYTKMARKKQRKAGNKIKLNLIYIILSILGGLLAYLAYSLKFPNTFNAIISIIFLVALIKNYKKISGINVLIYMLIMNAVITPLSAVLFPLNLIAQIIIFAINLIFIVALIIGLKSLKIWACYLALIAFILSAVNNIMALITSIPGVVFPASILFILQIVLAVAFALTAFVYLIKSRKYFKK